MRQYVVYSILYWLCKTGYMMMKCNDLKKGISYQMSDNRLTDEENTCSDKYDLNEWLAWTEHFSDEEVLK